MTAGIRFVLLAVGLALLSPVAAHAHFLWLVRQVDQNADALRLYFAELAEPGEADLLSRLEGATAWRIDENGKTTELDFECGSAWLAAKLVDTPERAMFVLQRDLGVMQRGGESFFLKYYAKTGPPLGDRAWGRIDCSKRLKLDLIPEPTGEGIRVMVKWEGKPIRGVQVRAAGPGMGEFEATSNELGQVTFTAAQAGIFSIRARYIEDQGGQSDGNSYSSTRHYSTLALRVAERKQPVSVSSPDEPARAYPNVPETVTSFGAAISEGALYTYGGHTGRAHAYHRESQANTLRRLDLQNPKAWESLGEGPGLQGLALVAHGGKLYRIGGFAAKNEEGDEHDLWSLADVACYDVATRAWHDRSPLPEPRSSFDAAVLGDKIYVVGGWQLAGEADSLWHKTAYALDLATDAPQWQPLPEPPFRRRALALAAHNGMLYAIGGMQEEGGPTTRVDVFDPATAKWSPGPGLQGEKMDGFGASAFATGGRLYVSTYSGKLQRLADDGQSWELVKQLKQARFFHRMLPISNTQLISLGGASMEVGKFAEIELIDVR